MGQRSRTSHRADIVHSQTCRYVLSGLCCCCSTTSASCRIASLATKRLFRAMARGLRRIRHTTHGCDKDVAWDVASGCCVLDAPVSPLRGPRQDALLDSLFEPALDGATT